MRQILNNPSEESKQNFSSAAFASIATTRNLDEYAYAMLNGIDYYSKLEKKYCYLSIIDLGQELTRWGAPARIGRTKAYALHKQLEKEGFITRYRRHRRATYESVLTEKGKQALYTLKFEPWTLESCPDNYEPEIPAATLPDNHDCIYKIKTNNTRESVDIFRYYRSEKTGLLVFSDDTIQNLADNYGFEVVRHAVSALKAAKTEPDNKIGYLIGILKNWKSGDNSMSKQEKTSSSHYENAFTAQERTQKATEYARKRLSELGVHYPVRIDGMSTIEFYDATLAYGQKEAALISEYLKPVAKPRPLAIDSTPKTPKWGQPYYD